MTPFDAIILGLIEGITEYLPVSSTGHLIIAASLLGLDRDPKIESAVNAFNIVIQGGAILAVIGLYRVRVWSMIQGLRGKDPGGRRLFIPDTCMSPCLSRMRARCPICPPAPSPRHNSKVSIENSLER